MASAQPTNPPKHYFCYQAIEKLVIDGKLNEKSWQLAPFSSYFLDIEGEKRPHPYYQTRVKMLWDTNYLYLAAYLEEKHIWATYTERESVIFHENDFEVFIDPDGDAHQYFELEINALGTIWDLKLTKPYRDGGLPDNSWNFQGLQSAVNLYGTINQPGDLDSGWTVELAIPWKTMIEYAPDQSKPGSGDHWRINFSRVQWELEVKDGKYHKTINPDTQKPFPEKNWVWSPQGVIDMHRPESWGYLHFSGNPVTQPSENNCNTLDYKSPAVLWSIYHWQRDNYKRLGKYLPLEDMSALKNRDDAFSPVLNFTPEGYLLSLKGDSSSWYLRSDGKIWQEH